ncbi:MAG: hypothetical protein ABL966_08025 [Acidimicrobiales bacterium]
MVDGKVEAWRVHDTGLVAVPSRFRRLGGLVRHLQGQGERWPDTVTLALDDGALVVGSPAGPVGSWPLGEVHASRVADGPPVSFVLEVPGGAHLLAAPAGPATEALLAALLG